MNKIDQTISKIKKHMLFKDVEDGYIADILDKNDTVIKNFSQKEIIFSEDNEEKVLGLILSGEANVYSQRNSSGVLIKTLRPTDSFGVANLFLESSRFVTTIIAKKPSTVVFFSKATIKWLIDTSIGFRRNYISFLSERICFLNRKISCFTAGSPEKKLSSFLCSQNERDTFSITVSSSTLSEMLGIGRASLYRAFDKMTEDGLIIKNGKTIHVPDRNKLNDFYKS